MTFDIMIPLTPAFSAGLERSGKPVRQHALVRVFHCLFSRPTVH
jgi:hypothetical protein